MKLGPTLQLTWVKRSRGFRNFGAQRYTVRLDEIFREMRNEHVRRSQLSFKSSAGILVVELAM